jgi:hypothetical protein
VGEELTGGWGTAGGAHRRRREGVASASPIVLVNGIFAISIARILSLHSRQGAKEFLNNCKKLIHVLNH